MSERDSIGDVKKQVKDGCEELRAAEYAGGEFMERTHEMPAAMNEARTAVNAILGMLATLNGDEKPTFDARTAAVGIRTGSSQIATALRGANEGENDQVRQQAWALHGDNGVQKVIPASQLIERYAEEAEPLAKRLEFLLGALTIQLGDTQFRIANGMEQSGALRESADRQADAL